MFTAYAPGVAAGAVHAGSAAFSSVAFVAFERVESADLFYEAIHGSRFVDEGVGSVCVAEVERAMSQALPRPVKKSCLAVMGTIEQDPDYLNFVKAYEEDGIAEKAARAAPPSLADTDALFGEAGIARAETGKKDAAAKRRALASGKRVVSAAPVVLTPLMEEIRSKRRSVGSKRGGGASSKGSRRTKRGVIVKNPGDPDPPRSEDVSGRLGSASGRGEDGTGRRGAARAETRKGGAAASTPSAMLQREGRGGSKASRSGRPKLTVVDPVTKAPVIIGAATRGATSKKQAQAQARRQRQRGRANASSGGSTQDAPPTGASASGDVSSGGGASLNGASVGAAGSNGFPSGMPVRLHGNKGGAPDVSAGSQVPIRLLTKTGRVQDGGTG